MQKKCTQAVQRISVLRVASAYRTVSYEAVIIISSTIPIELLVEERCKMWNARQAGEVIDRTAIRQETLRRLQEMWRSCIKGRWTAKLIAEIEPWFNRKHGEVNYYTTQMLSGHGYFQKYLYKMGKTNSPLCIYGCDSFDDANHTFFECERWRRERLILDQKVCTYLNEVNIVSIILLNEENWKNVTTFVESVLRLKKRDLDARQLSETRIQN